MRRVLAVLLLALTPGALFAAAEQRIALVIGNAHYDQRPLANPVNDARLIAERLRALGFAVDLREDIKRGELIRSLQDYGRKAGQARVSFFYYAGHGVQLKGKNYLLPVDARLESEDDVQGYGVDVGILLDKLNDAKDRPHVVVLDACRNNPFRTTSRGWVSGLAGMEQSPEGTLIAFSTAPNHVATDGAGTNSLYTQALAEAMLTPQRDIELVFKDVARKVREATSDKQVPWYHSSLVGDVVLNMQGTAPTVAPMAKPATAQPNKKVALRSYGAATALDKPLVPLAKLMNPGLAEDYQNKLVRVNAQFLAPGNTEGWVWVAIPSDVMSKKVVFRVTAPGSDAQYGMGGVPPHVFINKENADLVFELQPGDPITLVGHTVVGKQDGPLGPVMTQVIFVADSVARQAGSQ